MMVQVMSPSVLVRLLRLDRGDDDSWLLFGPGPPVTEADIEEEPMRWAAE